LDLRPCQWRTCRTPRHNNHSPGRMFSKTTAWQGVSVRITRHERRGWVARTTALHVVYIGAAHIMEFAQHSPKKLLWHSFRSPQPCWPARLCVERAGRRARCSAGCSGGGQRWLHRRLLAPAAAAAWLPSRMTVDADGCCVPAAAIIVRGGRLRPWLRGRTGGSPAR
jgi:hypothetical protein